LSAFIELELHWLMGNGSCRVILTCRAYVLASQSLKSFSLRGKKFVVARGH